MEMDKLILFLVNVASITILFAKGEKIDKTKCLNEKPQGLTNDEWICDMDSKLKFSIENEYCFKSSVKIKYYLCNVFIL